MRASASQPEPRLFSLLKFDYDLKLRLGSGLPTLGGALRPTSTPLVEDSAELADPYSSSAGTYRLQPIGGEPCGLALSSAGFSATTSRIGAQNMGTAREARHPVATFEYESGIKERDPELTTAKRNEFETDFCRQLARLESWAAEQQWAPWTPPELRVVVSDVFEISKSLVPAWNGDRGRMEFPAWRVIGRTAAIAHELTHVFFPNGNRFLAEGLAVHVQDRIGENPAFPNFGRPLHELVRERLHEMVPELVPGDLQSLRQIRLAELDAIATPSPLTLKVGQDFYGEEPRGQARIYPIAGSFVRFLVETRGMEKFRRLYERTPLAPLAQDAGSPERWRDVYGASLAALELEWESLILNTTTPSSLHSNFNREHGNA
jgi:hypothetical protein